MNQPHPLEDCPCYLCRQARFLRKARELETLRRSYDAVQQAQQRAPDVLPLTTKDVKFLKACGIAP